MSALAAEQIGTIIIIVGARHSSVAIRFIEMWCSRERGPAMFAENFYFPKYHEQLPIKVFIFIEVTADGDAGERREAKAQSEERTHCLSGIRVP